MADAGTEIGQEHEIRANTEGILAFERDRGRDSRCQETAVLTGLHSKQAALPDEQAACAQKELRTRGRPGSGVNGSHLSFTAVSLSQTDLNKAALELQL